MKGTRKKRKYVKQSPKWNKPYVHQPHAEVDVLVHVTIDDGEEYEIQQKHIKAVAKALAPFAQ